MVMGRRPITILAKDRASGRAVVVSGNDLRDGKAPLG
jgi:hypothetical protein